MKKSDDVELVKKVLTLNEQMNELSVDKINESAPVNEPETEIKLTAKQRAEELGLLYIEPKRTLPAFGKLPEKQRKEHASDWEYVKGIYENIMIKGEGIEFWLCKYPGDPDCLWGIPCNRPVYVPRMVAKHLEEVQRYHEFDYVEKPSTQWQKNDYTHQFAVKNTLYRGKFRPIEAFA